MKRMFLFFAALVGMLVIQTSTASAQCAVDSGNLLKNGCLTSGIGPFEAWTGSRATVDTTHGEAMFTITSSGDYDGIQFRQEFPDAGYNGMMGEADCVITSSHSGPATVVIQDAGSPWGYRGLWSDITLSAGQPYLFMSGFQYVGSGPLKFVVFLGGLPASQADPCVVHIDNLRVVAMNPNGQFMNGGFEDGVVPWVSQFLPGGSLTLSSPGCIGLNSGHVVVVTPDNDWQNQIRQENLQLAAGRWKLPITVYVSNSPEIAVEVSYFDGSWHADVDTTLTFALGACDLQNVYFSIEDAAPKRTVRVKFHGSGVWDVDTDLQFMQTPVLPTTWGAIKARYRTVR